MLRIGFLGAGNMAFALAGAVSEKMNDTVIIPYDISRDRLELFASSFPNVQPAGSAEELAEGCDVLFLSVKPQMMRDAISSFKEFSGLALSIAAGLKLSFFEELMPRARVVRVMPNTPCLVGEMAAGYSAGSRVTKDDLALTARLLEAAGRAVFVEEEMLDAVTGISGSGPAYFARIAEAFIDAGIDAGLKPELARELTLQTMKGTAALLQEKNMSPKELVAMVSSPGGTTVAGRAVLEASDYRAIVAETVSKTIERSKELGK
ncbi:MAG: pyrroline-5-carboxylate reductase [Spirochaetales bacterium]|nr:pyrroline-5-carboxylate reductase [Spirochaetales bacterium]